MNSIPLKKYLSLKQSTSIKDIIGDTDIYLIDQIMKGRYKLNDTILDAGCGEGRNMYWFFKNNINIYGIDSNEETIRGLKNTHPSLPEERLQISLIEKMPFRNNFFDHILSSAVLHFATTTMQFQNMITEMVRVLKPGGTLFIRMTSDIGIEDKVQVINNGVYSIPDGSVRFLLTRPLLATLLQEKKLSFIEPLKTVNVDDVRCMSTLVLQK